MRAGRLDPPPCRGALLVLPLLPLWPPLLPASPTTNSPTPPRATPRCLHPPAEKKQKKDQKEEAERHQKLQQDLDETKGAYFTWQVHGRACFFVAFFLLGPRSKGACFSVPCVCRSADGRWVGARGAAVHASLA